MSADTDARKEEAAARQAEAEARKAEIEADTAAAAARRDQVKALVPDLSAATGGTLDTDKDTVPMLTPLLSFGALQAVAASIAKSLAPKLASARRILVTSDPDLVAAEAVYRDVTSGLDQLKSAANALISKPQEPALAADFVPVFDIAEGVASALPAVISLLSAHRTVSTSPAAVSDLAGAAAVAGALRRAGLKEVEHDTFRVTGESSVYDAVKELADVRQKLVAEKLTLAGDSASAATVRMGLITDVIAAFDAFTAAIRVVPQGTTRSPLAIAALQSELHGTDEPAPFSHVLLVKVQAGQAQQELEHRALIFSKDKFSAIAEISITYMLLETETSTVLEGGTLTGTESAHGELGNQPTIDQPVLIPELAETR